MPPITSHQSSTTTKMLFIGDSGTGKTGALASLAAAGYNLRILDFDNGLDVLRDYLTNPASPYVKQNPKAAANVEFRTLTDPMRNLAGRLVPAKAITWDRAMKMVDHWKYEHEGVAVDLGKLTTWGPQEILVLDSLTMLSTAALNFHLQMNGALGTTRTSNEARRDIGGAQTLLRSLLELLYDSAIRCNVIVMGHITLVNDLGGKPGAGDSDAANLSEHPAKGYPSAIGRALSPHIPRYFNTVLLADIVGQGIGAKHRIFTKSRGNVPLKNTAPLRVAPEYPLESGLAQYFAALRES